MKIIVFGGDGFCGWPTALRLCKDHQVLIVDNLSRRKIDIDLGTESLTDIETVETRITKARELVGDVDFKLMDLEADYQDLCDLLREFQPDAVVHFAEQRSAPYSMVNSKTRRYTVENNVTSTHNICSAIVEVDPKIHLVHLGTMGVYGYSKEFGQIPEGYLDVEIKSTGAETDILYPANPGSVYHLTKCLDQLVFQFYCKNWGLRVTDLHQGIVWGINTPETRLDSALVNRFDYDGIYGTVLNRFLVQAANGYPLTVYGTGGQSRAFINISDTAECVKLAVESGDKASFNRVRIFNQVSEVQSVKGLAKLVGKLFGVEVENVPNPRKELAENELEVENEGLKGLGFNPITLNDSLIQDVKDLAEHCKDKFDQSKVLNSPKW